MSMSKEEFLSKLNYDNFMGSSDNPQQLSDNMKDVLPTLIADAKKADFEFSDEICGVVAIMITILRAKGLLPIPQNMKNGKLEQRMALEDLALLACYCHNTYCVDEN